MGGGGGGVAGGLISKMKQMITNQKDKCQRIGHDIENKYNNRSNTIKSRSLLVLTARILHMYSLLFTKTVI